MKSTILKNFLSIATLNPKQIAIYYKNTKITYAELLIQVKQYGQYFSNLQQKGTIAIHMDRTPQLIAAMLGCWYANRAFITLDCKHPIERKKYVLGNNITDSHIQEITVIDSELDEDIAYILYTSGSTGQPKGIDITHEGVTALVNWAQIYYRKEQLQCILASTTITFDLSIFEIFVPLTCGCSIYLVDSILDLLNNDQDYSKITLINTVPAAMREIVRAKVIPFNVSTINLAGEALTWDLVKDLYQIDHIQEVYNLWGPSEDTTYSTVYQCPRYPDTELRKIPIVPIGQSIKGTKVHIIDQEICLSGISLARGYHNNLELTEKKFITYQGNRLYRTGDIGVIDDEGNIHFKGRIDLQVKVRGFRIELEEIESHLININNVIAAGATTITDNNQTRLIVGVQVNQINSQVSIEYLKNKLAENIPDYMMPHLWWVTDQPLSRTPNGKLCRKSLGKIILENNKIKSQITEIKLFYDLVSSILVKDINHNLSFTANGGDSLNAVRLLTECNQRWQHNLNLFMILDKNKTLTELNNQVFINNTNKIITKNYPQLKEQVLPSERRMWEVYNSSATPSAYNVAIQFELTGEIDIARLIYSIEQIINQNDVFKYNYIQYDNQLTKIATNTKLNILEHINDDFFELKFNLEHDFLGRVALIAENQVTLYFCFPHVVIDGLAIDALLKQISQLYNHGVINIEQPRFVLEGNFSRAVEFWYNKFVNKIQLCNWPSNNVRDKNSYQSISSLSKLQVNELKSIVNKLNITLPSLLLSIFSITLYRLGLGDNLIIGCPVANRIRLEQRDFVCNLTNTLPIRTIIDRDINLTEFLIRNYQEFLEMLSYQDISIDKIITALSTQIDLPSSMFEVLFSFMDFGHSLELKDIISKRKFNFPRNAKAPLVLSVVTNVCGNIELIFESIGNKVDYDFLNTISDIYKNLVLTLNDNLDYAIDNIDILPEAHKEIIRKKAIYSKTKANMHLAEWFINTSYKYKSNIAIIDGEVQISYQELLHEARKIAIAILDQTAGVKQGIGLSLDRSWKIVSSILGIVLAGCYYVPLDPRNPEVRTNHIIKDSGINLIINDTNYLSYSCPNTSDISKIQEVNYNIDDIAYIIYTSGTTGTPKGVAISHRNISSLFLSCQEWANFSSQDVWSLFHSYAFDFSVWEIFGAMLYGSKLIIISVADSINSKNFIEIVNKHRITILNQTPTAFKNLLSANVDLIHIPRLIIFGGEALYIKELEPWFNKYRVTNTLVNMYGITEVTIHATWKVITDDTTALYSNIGIPITDTGVVIVNDKGMICPINVPGEIWVSGERICEGYINLPETNKQKFVNKNFLQIISDRFYKSGDCAKLNNNGEFEFLGRIDQQLKINGHRIESAEIIAALKSYQSIIDACLQVIRSEQNIQILVAYYLGDKNIISHQLSNFLSNILPYYAIPTYYIHLDYFPMTINGKIDYACLPDISTSCHIMDFNNANNIEDKVKSIWTRLLNLTHLDDQYGFFEAGGNSIKALLLAQELNQTFENCGICMSIVDIFRYPSIKAQIEFIRNIISKEVV